MGLLVCPGALSADGFTGFEATRGQSRIAGLGCGESPPAFVVNDGDLVVELQVAWRAHAFTPARLGPMRDASSPTVLHGPTVGAPVDLAGLRRT